MGLLIMHMRAWGQGITKGGLIEVAPLFQRLTPRVTQLPTFHWGKADLVTAVTKSFKMVAQENAKQIITNFGCFTELFTLKIIENYPFCILDQF